MLNAHTAPAAFALRRDSQVLFLISLAKSKRPKIVLEILNTLM